MAKKTDEYVELTQDELDALIDKRVEESSPKLIGDPVPGNNFSNVNFRRPKRTDERGLPIDEFSFVRFFEAKTDHKKFTGFEGEAISESQKKSLSWASGSSGGYWVGAEFLPEQFIEYYYAAQICRQAGIRVLPCTGAPVNIPKNSGSVTTYWTTQNATITASDVTPGQLQLTPKFLTARSQFSRFLFKTSGGSAEDIIRSDMATAMAEEIDAAVLEGSGSSSEPTGMVNTSSINTVTAGNEALTMDDLRDMEYELQYDNVKFKKPAWLMHPRTWHGIQEFKINSEANHFMFNPFQQDAARKFLLGYPVYVTTSISIDVTTTESATQANLMLADMDDIILAEWSGIAVDATDTGGNAWTQNAIEVRAVTAVDVGVRNANSICLINDTTT